MNPESRINDYIEGNQQLIIRPLNVEFYSLPDSIKETQRRLGFLFLFVPAVIIALLVLMV